jgi:hypothetical protein
MRKCIAFLCACVFSTFLTTNIVLANYSILPSNPNSEKPNWLLYKNTPGEVVSDSVTIVNNSSAPATYDVYAVDATAGEGGAFTPKNASSENTGPGKWFSLSKSSITLDPKESAKIPFTMTIPTTTSPGQYTAAIMMHEKVTPAADRKTSGAIISTRVGVRAYIDIAETSASTSDSEAPPNKTQSIVFIVLGILLCAGIGIVAWRKKCCSKSCCTNKESCTKTQPDPEKSAKKPSKKKNSKKK